MGPPYSTDNSWLGSYSKCVAERLLLNLRISWSQNHVHSIRYVNTQYVNSIRSQYWSSQRTCEKSVLRPFEILQYYQSRHDIHSMYFLIRFICDSKVSICDWIPICTVWTNYYRDLEYSWASMRTCMLLMI